MKDEKYAKSHLNFYNIAIAVHHGKVTALLLVQLCKHFGLDYFVINDWDFEEDFIDELRALPTEDALKVTNRYLNDEGRERNRTSKAMINVNWQLLQSAVEERIHFNIPKLEGVIGYGSDDKSSIGIWNHINQLADFNNSFFPQKLINFLEIDTLTSIVTPGGSAINIILTINPPQVADDDEEDDISFFS